MATDRVSEGRIALLHPLIRLEALEAYRKAVRETPVGVHPFIVQTHRTFKEQDALYAKGRTKPGNKVTHVKAGYSFHNYGLAIDFALQINGNLVWEVSEDWITVVEIYKSFGWEWGGNWKTKDYPHLQRTLGYTARQLLGKYNRGEFISPKYVNI